MAFFSHALAYTGTLLSPLASCLPPPPDGHREGGQSVSRGHFWGPGHQHRAWRLPFGQVNDYTSVVHLQAQEVGVTILPTFQMGTQVQCVRPWALSHAPPSAGPGPARQPPPFPPGLAADLPSSLQALDLMPQTLGPPPSSWDGEMKAKAPFLTISLELEPGRSVLSSCLDAPGAASGPGTNYVDSDQKNVLLWPESTPKLARPG